MRVFSYTNTWSIVLFHISLDIFQRRVFFCEKFGCACCRKGALFFKPFKGHASQIFITPLFAQWPSVVLHFVSDLISFATSLTVEKFVTVLRIYNIKKLSIYVAVPRSCSKIFKVFEIQEFQFEGNTLPSQTQSLQGVAVEDSPLQYFPPFLGLGLVQVLVRTLIPPPQLTLHLSDWLQLPQPPSTFKTIIICKHHIDF